MHSNDALFENNRTRDLHSRQDHGMKHKLWRHASSASLFAVLLIFILLWLHWPQEFIASDPWGYSRRAFGIAETGGFGYGHVFDHRLAVTLPTALFYKALGVNIHTTNLVSLLSCLLIICTVWLALPDRLSKFIGTVLCLTSVPLFKASLSLYPDIIAAAFMALSFQMLLFRSKIVPQQATPGALFIPLLAVGALFTAFLAKLSAYWVLPLWIWAFVSDLKSDERTILLRRFYLPAFAISLFLGAGYLLFCYLTWENPLARLKAIQSLTGKHLWAWDNASNRAMLKRLTVSPAQMLISLHGLQILALACLSAFTAPRSVRPWSYYALCTLLFFWFGSTSFTSYQPLPLVGRMALPILPAIIILAAYLTSRLVASFSHHLQIHSYLPVIFVTLLAAISFGKHLVNEPRKTLAEAKVMEIVRQAVVQNPSEEILLICSDLSSPDSLAFYFGYHYPENLRVTYWGNLYCSSRLPEHTFVFIDRSRSAFLKNAYGHIHYDAELDALGGESLHHSGSVTLRRLAEHQRMRELPEPNKRMESDN